MCGCDKFKEGVHRISKSGYVCAGCREDVSEDFLYEIKTVRIPILTTIIKSNPANIWPERKSVV